MISLKTIIIMIIPHKKLINDENIYQPNTPLQLINYIIDI